MGAADRATISDPTTPSVWVSVIPAVAAAAQPAEPPAARCQGDPAAEAEPAAGHGFLSRPAVAAKHRRRSITVRERRDDADNPRRPRACEPVSPERLCEVRVPGEPIQALPLCRCSSSSHGSDGSDPPRRPLLRRPCRCPLALALSGTAKCPPYMAQQIQTPPTRSTIIRTAPTTPRAGFGAAQ